MPPVMPPHGTAAAGHNRPALASPRHSSPVVTGTDGWRGPTVTPEPLRGRLLLPPTGPVPTPTCHWPRSRPGRDRQHQGRCRAGPACLTQGDGPLAVLLHGTAAVPVLAEMRQLLPVLLPARPHLRVGRRWLNDEPHRDDGARPAGSDPAVRAGGRGVGGARGAACGGRGTGATEPRWAAVPVPYLGRALSPPVRSGPVVCAGHS